KMKKTIGLRFSPGKRVPGACTGIPVSCKSGIKSILAIESILAIILLLALGAGAMARSYTITAPVIVSILPKTEIFPHGVSNVTLAFDGSLAITITAGSGSVMLHFVTISQSDPNNIWYYRQGNSQPIMHWQNVVGTFGMDELLPAGQS